MPTTYDFFISYTSVDEKWAHWIAWELEEDGYKCFFQARDFVPSQSFVARMQHALDASNQMIAVFSDDYFKSEFCLAELEAAFVASMLVPVRVRRCAIPKLYRARIYIDLWRKSPNEAHERLIDGIRANLVGRHKSSRKSISRPKGGFPGLKSEVEPPKKITRKKTQLRSTTRLLLLGCAGESGLDIAGEFDRISSAINKAEFGKSFQIKEQLEVTAESLFEQLNSVRPHIFHFSGKQDAGRILIRRRDGTAATVDESALSGMFRSLDEGIVLAIFDTCYSLRAAREVAKTVDAAIGVKSWIFDEEATSYYEGFYRALASGRSLLDACGQAVSYAVHEGAARSRLPELCCDRIDPRKFFFTKQSKANV